MVKKAIPTEYKGVVYRSKSEAMFARYLELEFEKRSRHVNFQGSGWQDRSLIHGVGGFQYEPSLGIDWPPDFLVWYSALAGGLPCAWGEILEYKPSRPTYTYIESFFESMFEWLKTLDRETGYKFSFGIYYGSVWQESRGVIQSTSISSTGIAWADIPVDWLAEHAEELKATRFDLEGE